MLNSTSTSLISAYMENFNLLQFTASFSARVNRMKNESFVMIPHAVSAGY